MMIYLQYMKELPVMLTEEQNTLLNHEAKKLGSNMASILRFALDRYFKSVAKPTNRDNKYNKYEKQRDG